MDAYRRMVIRHVQAMVHTLTGHPIPPLGPNDYTSGASILDILGSINVLH